MGSGGGGTTDTRAGIINRHYTLWIGLKTAPPQKKRGACPQKGGPPPKKKKDVLVTVYGPAIWKLGNYLSRSKQRTVRSSQDKWDFYCTSLISTQTHTQVNVNRDRALNNKTKQDSRYSHPSFVVSMNGGFVAMTM